MTMVLKFTLSLNVIVKMMKNLSKSTKNSRLVQICVNDAQFLPKT